MITRKIFLHVAVAAAAGAVGCKSEDTNGGGGKQGGGCQSVSNSLTNNHGHVVGIPPADVTSGADKTYSIKGTSAHDHSFTVTAAQFQELLAGKTVNVDTTRSGAPDHLHTVGLSCTMG